MALPIGIGRDGHLVHTDPATAVCQLVECIVGTPQSPWTGADWFEIADVLEDGDADDVKQRLNGMLARLGVQWATVENVAVSRDALGRFTIRVEIDVGPDGNRVSAQREVT